jgi:hypothetical protein
MALPTLGPMDMISAVMLIYLVLGIKSFTTRAGAMQTRQLGTLVQGVKGLLKKSGPCQRR